MGKKRGHPVPDPERKRVASLFAQGITVLDAMDVCVGIGLTSMYKFKRQYDAVGHCDAGLHGKPPKKYRTLRTGHKMFLLMAIALSLTPTARQWAEVLEEEFGLDIGEEAVRRDMHESGLTKVVAAPMDERAFLPQHIQSAAEWELLRPTLPAKKIVWIDETGKKPSDMEPTEGWSPVNTTCAPKQIGRSEGENSMFIAAMHEGGVLSGTIACTNVNVTGWLFERYLWYVVIPQMKELGLLYCCMDNAPPHRHAIIAVLFRAAQLQVFFLPPYRPWNNPIEGLFNATLHICHQIAGEIQANFVARFRRALENHPASTCKGLVAKAGYV